MPKKIKLVVEVNSGLINIISSSKNVEVLVLDYDVQDDSRKIKPYPKGKAVPVGIDYTSPDYNPEEVEHYFKQV